MRKLLVACGLLGVLCLLVSAAEEEQKDEPRVTLTVEKQKAADVAAEIAKQIGLQVAVTAKTDAEVTLTLKDAKAEEAVKALAEAFDGSWLRGYLIEKQPPPQPYTAEQYIAAMQALRDEWMASLSDEQRAELFAKWREAFRRRREQAPGAEQGQPGAQGAAGAVAGAGTEGAPATPGAPGGVGGPAVSGGPGGRGGRGGGFGRLYDPLRTLMFPEQLETISLKLGDPVAGTGVSLQQAQYALMAASGYIAVAEQGLAGQVCLDVKDTAVGKVVEEIAKAVGAKARVFYVVSQPKELSEAEAEAMQQAAWDRRWNQFWSRSPEERKAEIERWVQRIGAMAERNPQRFQRFGQRMLNRLAQYSARLTPQQRMELKPLLQAIGGRLNR